MRPGLEFVEDYVDGDWSHCIAMLFGDGTADHAGYAATLPAGWAEHGRTFVAHDPTDDLDHGFDYGRQWWLWPQYPGSMAAHGFEGQFTIVVPDRELTVVHLGRTATDVRRHLIAHLDDLISTVPVTA